MCLASSGCLSSTAKHNYYQFCSFCILFIRSRLHVLKHILLVSVAKYLTWHDPCQLCKLGWILQSLQSWQPNSLLAVITAELVENILRPIFLANKSIFGRTLPSLQTWQDPASLQTWHDPCRKHDRILIQMSRMWYNIIRYSIYEFNQSLELSLLPYVEMYRSSTYFFCAPQLTTRTILVGSW